MVGAIAGLTSVILVMILAQARIFLSMSSHGLIPPAFGKVHPRYRTPHVATAVTGTIAAIAAGLLPIGILGELVSIGTLIAFIVVCVGVLVLRYKRPELPRPFRVKAVWPVSLLGIGFCGTMALGPAGRHLVAAHHLDRGGSGYLLRLRLQPQQVTQRCVTAKGGGRLFGVASAVCEAPSPQCAEGLFRSISRRRRMLIISTTTENAIAKYR